MTDRPHVGADALADLQEGLLDAEGEATVRRHLESCPGCREDLAALTAVPALLAASGDVGPLPPEVAARLDGALESAAAHPADTSPAAETSSPAARTVTPLRGERSAPRGLRLLQAAAVVVVLLGLGALAVSALPRGGDSGSSAGSAAPSSSDRKEAATAKGYPLSASGRDWTPDALATAVPSLLAGTLQPGVTYRAAPSPAGDSASGGAGTASRLFAGAPAARLAGGPALAACVAELAGAPATPLAVDLSTFQGQPAAVIVLPDAADAARAEIWVVGPQCSGADAKLLYFASVPRS